LKNVHKILNFYCIGSNSVACPPQAEQSHFPE